MGKSEKREASVKMKPRIKVLLGVIMGIFTSMMCALPVLASENVGSGTSEVSAALNTAFAEITSSMLNLVAQILPIVLPVLGAITLIKFGINVYKKVTTKAS